MKQATINILGRGYRRGVCWDDYRNECRQDDDMELSRWWDEQKEQIGVITGIDSEADCLSHYIDLGALESV